MIERDEYAVRLLDLPADVGGFITESPDGFLNIYINARHSRDQQRRSLRHELRHADADDLHSSDPVSTIEAQADGEADMAEIDLSGMSYDELVALKDQINLAMWECEGALNGMGSIRKRKWLKSEQ